MNEPEFRVALQNRIDQVQARVADACRRAGRRREEVTIVAVTKSLSLEATRLALECGLSTLGENRPQQLWIKAPALPQATWHFMGHLQRNKIDRTLPLVTLIHSVDSVRLLDALDAEAGKQGRRPAVLLEVNASGEGTKQGFAPDEVVGLADRIRELKNVRVAGLMTMAAPLDNPELCRPTFARLRSCLDKLRPLIVPGHPCTDLSMGMTNDFEIAIEEGATLVRLGSVYFAGLS